MQGCEGFILHEAILEILIFMLKNDLRTLIVGMRSFLEYFLNA